MTDWRPVVGYEGFYEVSDDGSVRSVARTVRHSNGGPKRLPGRPMKLRIAHCGHLSVNLSQGGRRRTYFAHVLVLEAFVGPRPDGQEACHSNGVPADNRLSNLRWDTPSANTQDRIRHGTDSNVMKTTCPLGHALFPPNLDGGEWRKCLACRSARDAAKYAAKIGRPFDLKSEADARFVRLLSGGTHCSYRPRRAG